MVLPASLSSWIEVSRNSRRTDGSRPPAGSSNSRSSGRWATAQSSATWRACPLLSVLIFAFGERPKRSRKLRTAGTPLTTNDSGSRRRCPRGCCLTTSTFFRRTKRVGSEDFFVELLNSGARENSQRRKWSKASGGNRFAGAPGTVLQTRSFPCVSLPISATVGNRRVCIL